MEGRHVLHVLVGSLSPQYEALSIEVSKNTLSHQIVGCITSKLHLTDPCNYELAEVIGNSYGEICKERRLASNEMPVCVQKLWPQSSLPDQSDFCHHEYKFYLREKVPSDSSKRDYSAYDSQLMRDYLYKFLYQPKDKEYADLCQLPDLTEQILLDNLKARFKKGYIYTYVGSILISVNPFKYYPIYNPKYVKLYQNHQLGDLPPHIFAIADAAYHSMLKQKRHQCIVISGESGSGKTESTIFLLHHLTMLSQKGSHGSGVEQTILSSSPVLEAFGNAKTAHNNNSSRFGKFIQVSYKSNGLVQGACVQKYLLEKSRICSQAYFERSYHVFYYLLAGASIQEQQLLSLQHPSYYSYLNKSKCYIIEGCDEQYEFIRLKQSMEMVGFSAEKQQRVFAILSAILLLGNVEFQTRKSSYHYDESVLVSKLDLISTISSLLGVSEESLISVFTYRKAHIQGETIIINYRDSEAIAARDSLAKCLYATLFDWIVLQINYALISLKDMGNSNGGHSIGVLDIFGFEDFGYNNRFEQFCINYANECLQHYFNQHVFEYEQEEYKREGISWTHIDFEDNVDCIALIEGKPQGLLCILDDQCSFPGATSETFLQKVNNVHKENKFYEIPQRKESAFIIKHYAGKVKYQVDDIKEKNLDLMRPELICMLKSSYYGVVRELVGSDPVAVYRWSILRAFFHAVQAFNHILLNTSKRKGSTEYQKSKLKVSVDHDRILAAIENNQNRLRKTRHNRTRNKGHGQRFQKSIKTVKAIAYQTHAWSSNDRIQGSRKPITVTGQFQVSLNQLMKTLNEANPYFIRCIKSNAHKEPNMFNDELVMRQLRYTGMLETVRIRQAGYNVRLTYDEFIHHYRILLPKGLLSSQRDVRSYLFILELDGSQYQMGRTKVYLRESQKETLDLYLQQKLLSCIIAIQRWYRSLYQRNYFVAVRASVIKIQSYFRMILACQRLYILKKQRNESALLIQKVWRGYCHRKQYQTFRKLVIRIQARIRGTIARRNYAALILERNALVSMEESDETVMASDPLSNHDSSEVPVKQEFSPKVVKYDTQLSSDSGISSMKERSYFDSTLPPTTVINRRHSETLMVHAGISSAHVKARRSTSTELDSCTEALQPVTQPEVHPRKDTAGVKSQTKVKSFRHRQYWKIPFDVSEISSEEENISPSEQNTHADVLFSGFPPSFSGGPQGRRQKTRRRSNFEPSENIGLNAITGEESLEVISEGQHNLKQCQLKKGDACAVCEKQFTSFFINTGHKCTICHQVFHPRCTASSNSVCCSKMASNIKESAGPTGGKKQRTYLEQDSKWNVTRTSQFIDKSDEVIKGPQELNLLAEFIMKKVCDLERNAASEGRTHSLDRSNLRSEQLLKASPKLKGRKDSQVDQLFHKSLITFRKHVLSYYGLAASQGSENDSTEFVIKYKDLIKNFEEVIKTLCKETVPGCSFPITMGVNAFRGFLDEFIREKKSNSLDKLGVRKRHRQRKKKRKVQEISFRGHSLVHMIVNIPTQCEVCNSFLWLSTKALSCQRMCRCKVTCHFKCYTKVEPNCSSNSAKGVMEGVGTDSSAPVISHVFGVPLEKLVLPEEKIPFIIEKIITHIEMYGLYCEGLYRKSGVASKVQEVKMSIEQNPRTATFEDVPVHVLTTVLKSIFREMPEPLLTFDAYDSLLDATLVQDVEDSLLAIIRILKGLPQVNYRLLERLIYHLARVAEQEKYNRMSCSALSIVFAPCILRSGKLVPVLESLQDISRQTQVIELLIARHLEKILVTMENIDTVDNAAISAGLELSNIRSSKNFGSTTSLRTISDEANSSPVVTVGPKKDPRIKLKEYDLEEKYENLQDERHQLAVQLASLVHASSEEDLLSSDMSYTGSCSELTSSSVSSLASSTDQEMPRITELVPVVLESSESQSGRSENFSDDSVMV